MAEQPSLPKPNFYTALFKADVTERTYLAAVVDRQSGVEMGNNKDPKKTRPGEMPPGKFHYNPGNMSGKTIGNAERQEDDVAVPVDQSPANKEPTTSK